MRVSQLFNTLLFTQQQEEEQEVRASQLFNTLIMQGFLYVENIDAPKLKYQSRYFVLFPFCGLRWFSEEPQDASEASLLTSGDDGGWIFGGNIRILSIIMEENDQEYMNFYPFVIYLSTKNGSHHIRLASDNDDVRMLWTDEIKKSIYIQNYIHSCIQCDAIPSKMIFCSALAGHDSVNIENIPLSIPTLGSLIMVCKFNYNLGTLLRVIHLENTSLSDDHCPLLSSLLSFTTSLESLSLANNYITDKGFISLISTLQNCTQLSLIDFSSNFLTDIGMSKLYKIFEKMKGLLHLDLSRNKLGTKSAKYLAFHLGGYDNSHLTFLNLSYNSMGNSVAQLVVLLLTVEKSQMINIDISFCHVNSDGIKELSVAVPKCKTLQVLNVCGNFGDNISFGLLIDSMTKHQRKFGLSAARDGSHSEETVARREALYNSSSQLDIVLGGMLITDAKVPKSLTFSTMRSVLSHLNEMSSTKLAVLRKRMDALFEQQNINDQNSLNQQKRHMDLKARKVNVVVCIRVQLMPYMESIHEFMESLSYVVSCDPRQLVILSASEIDESDSTFIIFTVTNASAEMQSTLVKKTIRKRCLDNESSGAAKSSLMSKGVIWLQPSAEKIALKLQQLSHKSSPELRNIGVRTVYIQRRDKFTNEPIGASYQCHIVGSGCGGNGLAESYIPPLFPYADALQEMKQPVEDPYLDVKPALDINLVNVDKVSGDGSRKLSVEAFNEPGFFFQEDEEDDDPLGLSDLADETNDEDGSLTRSLLYTADNVSDTSTTVQVDDAKFFALIKRLKIDYEINTDAGEFWSAVFGDPDDERNRGIIDDGLNTAHNEEGVFHSVGIRQQLCTAMFERDKETISTIINEMKAKNISGGDTIELAERLINEISMLRRDSEHLDALAQGPDDIGIVEEFLMNCGRIGYTGPEILVAVELREYLVQWAMELDETFENAKLGSLKQRALITNLMISRNFDVLEPKLLALRNEISENIYEEATTLLENANTVRQNLTRAMNKNDRQLLENVLAEAAYYNVYDDVVMEAIECVTTLSKDVSTVFADLVNALQDGSKGDLENVFVKMDNIGWNHPIVEREMLLKMFDRRNQLIEETNAMNELHRISNILQQSNSTGNEEAKTADDKQPPVKTLEIMSCIRSIKNLGLAQIPEARAHISILENQVKKAAKLASQEDEILQLIDSRDYEKLADMMSGVGSGTLVMSAATEDEMAEWIQIMELVCKLGSPKQLLENTDEENAKLSSIRKSGTLEKAARGKEKKYRNWKQRFFLLEGLTISYFTKEGGERKGCVRVGGGKIRRLDATQEESSGRKFCFELREGRDLSSIDPDLIKEAHRQVSRLLVRFFYICFI